MLVEVVIAGSFMAAYIGKLLFRHFYILLIEKTDHSVLVYIIIILLFA